MKERNKSCRILVSIYLFSFIFQFQVLNYYDKVKLCATYAKFTFKITSTKMLWEN